MVNTSRILLVDDNEAIHEDIEAILSSHQSDDDDELQELEGSLFGEAVSGNTYLL
jgi:CheY-like chemotaxis protein